MVIIKKLGISLLYIVGLVLIFTFLITLLNYFNIIGSKIVAITQITAWIISLLIGGIILGRHSLQKGWLEGLKLSGIVIFILIIFNYLIFDNSFAIKDLLFYLILSIAITFGSMLGIKD